MGKKKIALILCSGGVRGSYTVGFLNALRNDIEFKNNYEIDSIHAYSIGAVIGYAFSNGSLYKIKKTILSGDCFNMIVPYINIKIFPYLFNLFLSLLFFIFNFGFFKNNLEYIKYNTIIKDNEKYDKNYDSKYFDNIKNNLYIYAYDFKNGIVRGFNEDDYTNKKICVYDSINAAMSDYPLKPPILIDGNKYTDCGIANLFSKYLIENKNKINEIWIIDPCNRYNHIIEKDKKYETKNYFGFIYDMVISSGHQNIANQYKYFKKVNPEIKIKYYCCDHISSYHNTYSFDKQELLHRFLCGKYSYIKDAYKPL